jgi:plasmid stabilization system protein ParE
VNLFIQEAAERDILRQIEWYAEKGVPAIGLRFSDAVAESLKAVIAMPLSGAPKATTNPRLAGLRTWPVKGFDEFRIYCLVQPELLTVLRVLHDNRDTDALLRRQVVQG